MNYFKKSLKIMLTIFLALTMAVIMPTNVSAEETLSWESTLMQNIGMSVSTSGNRFFSEGEEVNKEIICYFVNMTSEMQQYCDKEFYYKLTFDQYMEIVDKYFQNYNKEAIRTELVQSNKLDGENIYYYFGGSGGGLTEWQATYCYVDASGYYHIQGVVLDDDDKLLGQYPNGKYIQYPVELVLTSNDSEDYKIVSYTKNTHYIEDTEDMGLTLTMFNEDEEGTIETYYAVILHDAMGAHISLTGTADSNLLELDGYIWRDENAELTWYTQSDVGYYCQMIITRLCDGNTSVVYDAYSGSITGKGEFDLRVIAMPIFTLQSDHAKVTVIQGLEDMGDGSYVYNPGSAIELKVEADEGYEVDSVVINHDNGFYYTIGQLNSFGTCELYPDELVPGVIEVSTHFVDKDNETVIITNDNSSPIKAIVEVAKEDAEQFDGLTFVVEEVDQDNATVSYITNQLDAKNVYLLDLHFVNEDGEEVKTNALMKVTVDIPEGWDPATTAVYYVNPDTKEITNMNGVVSEDGKTITFTTNHFSYYALVQNNTTNQSVNTGDNSHIALWTTVLFVAGASVFVVSAKKKQKKS